MQKCRERLPNSFISPIMDGMKNLTFLILSVFSCAFFVSGCDSAQPLNKGQVEQPAAAPVDEPEPVEEAPAANPAQVNAPVQNTDNTVTVRPGYNFSGRGSSLASADGQNPMGIITVPVKTLFVTQDRLVLQQIEYAMKMFHAEHGRAPASETEFTDRIINANNIKLPQLPAGQIYFYDPQDGELKIRKPG